MNWKINAEKFFQGNQFAMSRVADDKKEHALFTGRRDFSKNIDIFFGAWRASLD
jgi:hypothetical protein